MNRLGNSRNLKIDVLINNPTPQIEYRSFLELTSEEFLSFISESVALYANPLRVLLPQLKKGSRVVQVSSIAVVEPFRTLSHYIAAKSAIEGMTKALALEHKNIVFSVVRPPQMLTDHTNKAFSLKTLPSAIEIARQTILDLKLDEVKRS